MNSKSINLSNKVREFSSKLLPTRCPETYQNGWYKTNQNNITSTIVSNTDEMVYTKRIDIFPKRNQRKLLNQYFNNYRRIYNIALAYYKNPSNADNIKGQMKFKQNVANLEKVKKLTKSGIPVHSAYLAIFEVYSMAKSAKSNVSNGKITSFDMKYRRTSDILKLDVEAFSTKKNSFYLKFLKNIRSSSSLKRNGKGGSTVIRNGSNFTLLASLKKSRKVLFGSNRSISLDPGVRTFLTGYAFDNTDNTNATEYHIGTNNDRISKLLNKLDKPVHNKGYKKYQQRIRDKIKNSIDDLHWKTANFLCRNYYNIAIGKINTQSCISNETSTLSNMTKRLLVSLSHFKFRQRLEYKAKEYLCNLKIVDESYTSKTCSSCGNVKNDLGGNKVYDCTNCKFNIDRDVNGARNILMLCC